MMEPIISEALAAREVVPQRLRPDERAQLVAKLPVEESDARVSAFIMHFEQALGRYALRKAAREERTPDAKIRQTYKRVHRRANQLIDALDSMPDQGLRELDFELQVTRGDVSSNGYVWSATHGLSEATACWFQGLEKDVQILSRCLDAIESRRAANSGGRPKNTPMNGLALDIAMGLKDLLKVDPTMTLDGPFANVLRIAVTRADGTDVTDHLIYYVRWAVDQTKHH